MTNLDQTKVRVLSNALLDLLLAHQATPISEDTAKNILSMARDDTLESDEGLQLLLGIALSLEKEKTEALIKIHEINLTDLTNRQRK